MYKITWDKEIGGVLLHSHIVEGTLVKQGEHSPIHKTKTVHQSWCR